MKNRLLFILITVALFFTPGMNFGQAPNLETTVDSVHFLKGGESGNTRVCHLSRHAGTNNLPGVEVMSKIRTNHVTKNDTSPAPGNIFL